MLHASGRGTDWAGTLLVVTVAIGGASTAETARAQLRFETYSEFPVGGDPRRIQLFDVDRDGLLDIVTAGSVIGLSVLFAAPNAPGARRVDVPITGGASALSIGDLDGDGVAEIESR
jgi:hypothetical protein